MRSQVARRKVSATEARNLRTLLLLNVFEPEEIGARIQTARERAGLRQEDLADLIGVANRTVQNYEAGATKPYARLKAIAEATGATVEWLLHGDPEPGEVSPGELSALQTELAAARGDLAALAGHLDEVLRILRERVEAEPEDQQQAG